MAPTIYVNGCSGCGYMGHLVRRVKHAYPGEVIVNNTRFDSDSRAEHAAWLTKAGLSADLYTPIVVINGEVTRLEEWQPLN